MGGKLKEAESLGDDLRSTTRMDAIVLDGGGGYFWIFEVGSRG